jgi:hypothetical protein
MSIDYCRDCALNSGLISAIVPVLTSGPTTSGQNASYMKHIGLRSGNFPINSEFRLSGWSGYQDLLMAGILSGSLQIDSSGRTSLVYAALNETGLQYCSGGLVNSCSGVRVVLAEYSGRQHAFPDPTAAESQVCAICGRPVPPYLPISG